jgi:hypothetical protein
MSFPLAVTEIVEALLAGLRDALGGNLVGVYLRGSLALGDFIPATSDIDVLAVTERPIDAVEFTALGVLHAQLAVLPNPYAHRLEMAYLDRGALRRFTPGLRHPTLGQGEMLTWSEHRDNWVLERWTVREHGVVLCGPAPQPLIDWIAPDALREAVYARLRDWADWADQPDDPEWLLPLSHKAYVVETMCRALYTMTHGTLCTKPGGVTWAMATLPEPWRSTVERSQAWRTDRTTDPAIVPEVMRFVRWAASVGEAAMHSARRPPAD